MYFKTEILCKFFLQSLALDFKTYTCVINNPYLSIGIHLVMQTRIALIPLITYTPPNDLATHNKLTTYITTAYLIKKHIYILWQNILQLF